LICANHPGVLSGLYAQLGEQAIRCGNEIAENSCAQGSVSRKPNHASVRGRSAYRRMTETSEDDDDGVEILSPTRVSDYANCNDEFCTTTPGFRCGTSLRGLRPNEILLGFISIRVAGFLRWLAKPITTLLYQGLGPAMLRQHRRSSPLHANLLKKFYVPDTKLCGMLALVFYTIAFT
jgi:hypothetical protein